MIGKKRSQGIYLDNNSIARLSEKAVQQMMPYLREEWGCPSSPHQKGIEVLPAVKESYRAIYSLLDASESDDFIFTSSGAEAVNHVIAATHYDVTLNTGKNHYVTSHIDEAPGIMAIGKLEKLGDVGKMVEPNSKGIVTAEAVANMITPRTALVSLSWANGLTGVINPVSDIAHLCQERGIRLHLDATHVLGKLFFELEDVGADFITFNGSPLHAPKGTGGILIRKGIELTPLISGGLGQRGKRAGTFDVPSFVALGAAAGEALESRDLLCTEVARLRNKLESGIVSGFPDAILFFQEQERLPNCTAIAFPGVANEAMLHALNSKGVYGSIGGDHFQQIRLILRASGVEEVVAYTAISFSLSRETQEDEIDRAIEIIVDTAKRLRKMSIQFM